MEHVQFRVCFVSKIVIESQNEWFVVGVHSCVLGHARGWNGRRRVLKPINQTLGTVVDIILIFVKSDGVLLDHLALEVCFVVFSKKSQSL